MPIFSIIVPVYKAEKYVKECLNSIQNQTLSDFEVLCVDDCGGDNSIEIIKEIAKTDNRIKILYNKTNKGVAAARNLALKNAKGEYVLCVDSDDWIEHNTLDVLYNIFQKYKVDSIWFDGYRYYENTKSCNKKPIHQRKAGFIDLNPSILPTYSDMCGMKSYTLSSIKAIGLTWPEDVHFDEDGEFYFKYYMHYPLVYSINHCLYYYRKHGSSISDGYACGQTGIIDTYKVIEHLKDYYSKHHVYDAYKITLLKLLENRIKLCLLKTKDKENKLATLNVLNNVNFPQDYINYEKDLEPLVTLVVPFYNVEPYIEHCVRSIMEQTYTNIEILCIDDCGQDNSIEIVKQLTKEDPRVKLIQHKKNKGLGGARNTGLKKAKGKYILFIDSDDWITKDCVESVTIAMNKTGLNSVWFKAKYWIEEEQKAMKMDFCEWYNNLPNTYKTLNHYNIGNFPVATWNKAYRVDYLKAKKLSWQENVIYEDVEFYWKLFTQSPQIYVLDKFLYYYRQREGSIVQENMKSSDKTQVPLNVMLRVYKYLKANNLYDKYKQSFIKFASDNISMFDKVINGNKELKKEKLKFLQKIL